MSGLGYGLWRWRSGQVLVTFTKSELTSADVRCQRKEKGEGWLQDIQVEMSGWPLEVRGMPSGETIKVALMNGKRLMGSGREEVDGKEGRTKD